MTVSRKAAVRYRDALLAARTRLVEEIDELDPDLVHDPGGYETASPQERELLDLLPHRHLLRSIDAAVVISQASSGQTPDPELEDLDGEVPAGRVHRALQARTR